MKIEGPIDIAFTFLKLIGKHEAEKELHKRELR